MNDDCVIIVNNDNNNNDNNIYVHGLCTNYLLDILGFTNVSICYIVVWYSNNNNNITMIEICVVIINNNNDNNNNGIYVHILCTYYLWVNLICFVFV